MNTTLSLLRFPLTFIRSSPGRYELRSNEHSSLILIPLEYKSSNIARSLRDRMSLFFSRLSKRISISSSVNAIGRCNSLLGASISFDGSSFLSPSMRRNLWKERKVGKIRIRVRFVIPPSFLFPTYMSISSKVDVNASFPILCRKSR